MIKQYLSTWHIQGLPADAQVESVQVEYQLDVIPVDSNNCPGITIMITGTATIELQYFREVVNETHYSGRDIVTEIYKEEKVVVDIYGHELEGQNDYLYRAQYEAVLDINDFSEEDCKANLCFEPR